MGECDNETSPSLDREWFRRFQFISSVVIPILFGIVFILGLISNATLIYTILANKWMRTKSNVLIVSLAGGDFLLILVSVPFASLLYTADGWWFGPVTCKVRSLFLYGDASAYLALGVDFLVKNER